MMAEKMDILRYNLQGLADKLAMDREYERKRGGPKFLAWAPGNTELPSTGMEKKQEDG